LKGKILAQGTYTELQNLDFVSLMTLESADEQATRKISVVHTEEVFNLYF
jgi:hypothetical protein